MQKYEITFITKGEVSKNNLPKKEIETLDGKVLAESSIGEKQFAYKIKKTSSGFYSTIVFELEPENLVALNKKLSLDEEVLRYLITKSILQPQAAPNKVGKKSDIPEMPKLTAEPMEISVKKVEEPVSKEVAKPTKKTPAKEIVKKEAKKREIKNQEALDEQERLDALDKKLDELLKE